MSFFEVCLDCIRNFIDCSDPLLPVMRTRKVFERFHCLMDEMYGYKAFQPVTLCYPIGEEFCPSTHTAVCDGIAMLFGSIITEGIQSNAVAFIVIYWLPVNQSDLRQIWFQLCCLAALTVVMSSRLLLFTK